MRFDVAELLDVFRQATEVGQVEGIQAVDEKDMDVVAAGGGDLLAQNDLLLGWHIQRMDKAEAALFAEQTQSSPQSNAEPPPTSLLRHVCVLPRCFSPIRAVPWRAVIAFALQGTALRRLTVLPIFLFFRILSYLPSMRSKTTGANLAWTLRVIPRISINPA